MVDCLTHTQASKKCQNADESESDVVEMGEDGSYDSEQQKPSKAKTVVPNGEQVKENEEEDSGLQREYLQALVMGVALKYLLFGFSIEEMVVTDFSKYC